jgi:hypothetical protein
MRGENGWKKEEASAKEEDSEEEAEADSLQNQWKSEKNTKLTFKKQAAEAKA